MSKLIRPFLFFIVCTLLSVTMAAAQKIPEGVKQVVSSKQKVETEKKQENAEDIQQAPAVDVGSMEKSALEAMADSTQDSIDEKKKEISDTVVKTQRAFDEKDQVQEKVKALKTELEKTQKQIKKALKEKTEVKHLENKSQQLEQQYQQLQAEFKLKEEKAQQILLESNKQKKEIDSLKEQLRRLEIEKNKHVSPRKKALNLAAIFFVMFVLMFLKDKVVSLIDRRLLLREKKNRSSHALRMRTLIRIFSWSVSVIFIAIAVFMSLELFGFDSTTTLAGAGVFGVAIGFGAQKFIKDIFSGLFLVLEGQYGINDFIAIGDHSGNVEDINLRFTKLRNYDGNIIYVPNGDIQSVVNYGKGYANAVINFYIDVQQNIDQVLTLVRETVSELREAPDMEEEILSDVELMGINAFTPNGIEVKFRIKSAPQSQWMVGRVVRLALKRRFDQDGIKLFQYQYKEQLVETNQ